MKDTKIIFFDIDGTLIDMKKKRVSEKVLEALSKLKDRGIKICIATGRQELRHGGIARWILFPKRVGKARRSVKFWNTIILRKRKRWLSAIAGEPPQETAGALLLRLFEGKLSKYWMYVNWLYSFFTRAAFWNLLRKRKVRGSGQRLCDLQDNRCRR